MYPMTQCDLAPAALGSPGDRIQEHQFQGWFGTAYEKMFFFTSLLSVRLHHNRFFSRSPPKICSEISHVQKPFKNQQLRNAIVSITPSKISSDKRHRMPLHGFKHCPKL